MTAADASAHELEKREEKREGVVEAPRLSLFCSPPKKKSLSLSFPPSARTFTLHALQLAGRDGGDGQQAGDSSDGELHGGGRCGGGFRGVGR